MRRSPLVLFLSLAIVLSASTNAFAETSLDATLRAAFVSAPGDDAGHMLARDGATFEHVAVAERLPNGEWMVEATLKVRGLAMRWPMRLAQDSRGWRVTWQPDIVFAKALSAMLGGDTLPESEHAPSLDDAARLPALPVILTKRRYVTPFGAIERNPSPDGLAPSIPLLKHAQAWVTLLAEDPAPAGVDIIADRNASWYDLNELIYSVSAAGLYRLSILTRRADGLGGIPASAPIAGFQSSQGAPPLVMGMYPMEGVVGFRIGLEGEIMQSSSPCAVEMSLCATSPEMFREVVTKMIADEFFRDTERTKHALFAATGEVTLEEGVRYLDAVLPALKLSPHAVLLGYIQR